MRARKERNQFIGGKWTDARRAQNRSIGMIICPGSASDWKLLDCCRTKAGRTEPTRCSWRRCVRFIRGSSWPRASRDATPAIYRRNSSLQLQASLSKVRRAAWQPSRHHRRHFNLGRKAYQRKRLVASDYTGSLCSGRRGDLSLFLPSRFSLHAWHPPKFSIAALRTARSFRQPPTNI